MEAKGNILKMHTLLKDGIVQYSLVLGDQQVDVNALVGKQLTLQFHNQINCIACGKTTNKSFGQGFCYNCFQSAPEAEECILHPEKCKAQYGIARDMEWSKSHCLQPHYVYLAVASGLKVGVTRHHQIPTRWIDQGAWKGMIIAETPNRHIAGVIEVCLKKYYSDKTNWRSMLKNELAEDIDLVAEFDKALSLLPSELQKYKYKAKEVQTINYPVEAFPIKPQTLSFDKQQTIAATLKGVKGQYLLFENSQVLNVRRHNGYLVSLTY